VDLEEEDVETGCSGGHRYATDGARGVTHGAARGVSRRRDRAFARCGVAARVCRKVAPGAETGSPGPHV